MLASREDRLHLEGLYVLRKRESSAGEDRPVNKEHTKPVDLSYDKSGDGSAGDENSLYNDSEDSPDILWVLGIAWMLCTMPIKNRTVQCFADTGVTRKLHVEVMAGQLNFKAECNFILLAIRNGLPTGDSKATTTVQTRQRACR